MGADLRIRDRARLDFLSLGALVHRLDPGVIPFRKATRCDIHVSGGEFNVAANLADCFRLQDRRRQRDGRLPDRRPDRRARARDGRDAVLQALRARRRHRAEHGHRLQRPRPRRPRPGRLLQPRQRGRGAAEAGRLRLERHLRRRRPLVPQRRHLRRAVRQRRPSSSSRPCRRRKAPAPSTSFDLNYREKLWKAPAAPDRAVAVARRGSSSTSTCSSATRRTCRRASASPGPRSRPSRSSIPSAFFGMIDHVVDEVSRT